MEAKDPNVPDSKVVAVYNQKFSRSISAGKLEKADVKILKQAR